MTRLVAVLEGNKTTQPRTHHAQPHVSACLYDTRFLLTAKYHASFVPSVRVAEPPHTLRAGNVSSLGLNQATCDPRVHGLSPAKLHLGFCVRAMRKRASCWVDFLLRSGKVDSIPDHGSGRWGSLQEDRGHWIPPQKLQVTGGFLSNFYFWEVAKREMEETLSNTPPIVHFRDSKGRFCPYCQEPKEQYGALILFSQGRIKKQIPGMGPFLVTTTDMDRRLSLPTHFGCQSLDPVKQWYVDPNF